MQSNASPYVAHNPDAQGVIHWSAAEHATWQALVQRQRPTLAELACPAYLAGTQLLQLSEQSIPDLADLDRRLLDSTGWRTEPVPALIDFPRFFALLSNRRFPVATFIRSRAEMDYLQEPDVFHEIFGHCPLLTNPAFARFTEVYGQLGLAASKEDRTYLARLYWFTVEFGLLQNQQGQRSIYGGGILSSPTETAYAYSSEVPERLPFDLLTVLRTPYRIDILQPVYFYLDSIEQLFDVTQQDIMATVQQAKKLGVLPARFPLK
ncbi:phenylalanine 4-monooxygenase [Reinekea sp.]|uniref:phenylalanine 4-monooxygenase n=1 Tax=Reinekea sp. TaxID=1970455 RepID=UPI002A80B8F5|nr:phenylalanine 4-monooxygenase [Reinekea sp.]